jgi:adenine-specific DNA-methyltransferase
MRERRCGMSRARSDETRMPLTSSNMVDERLEQLRDVFPEVFREGKVDFERLRQALGEDVDEGRERYGLSWAGKSDAIRAIQIPSIGTLKPVPEESINFDTTGNLFIEGDNLEVLKLLQNAYHSRVKMIYIDPPYNTGRDFIYSDNYRDGLGDYLRRSGQTDEEGVRQSTNAETEGRYHSNWLSMMYPRLFLARNLLAQDGAIFVSIDDNEVQDLRLLMDEILGGENFVATVIWEKVYSPKRSAKYISEDHDYVVVYARNLAEWEPGLLPRTAAQDKLYKNPDDDPRGPWKTSDLSARNAYSKGLYAITCPSGRRIDAPPMGNYWRFSREKFEQLDADNRIWWGKDGSAIPQVKRFLSEVKQGRVPQTLWRYKDVGHTQEAKKELLKYVPFENTANVLNSVKPPRLIRRMLQIATSVNTEDIILDFFGGSGSTAQAVLQQNTEDGGNRQFIVVQFPEPLPEPEKGLATIFDMAKMRASNVIQELEASATSQPAELDMGEEERTPQDLGFKTFKLATSSFRIWESEDAPTDAEGLAKQLELYADNVLPGQTSLQILCEIVLKSGFPLHVPVEERQIHKSAVYWVDGGLLAICLEARMTKKLLRGIMELKPSRVLCLDHAFGEDDQLKTNTVLEMKSQEIAFQTV